MSFSDPRGQTPREDDIRRFFRAIQQISTIQTGITYVAKITLNAINKILARNTYYYKTLHYYLFLINNYSLDTVIFCNPPM